MRYRVVRRISKHKTILSILFGVLLAYLIFSHPQSIDFLQNLGEFKLLGAMISGFFFSSGVTTAPSLVSIYFLASNYHPFWIAVFGGIGAMFADIFLYRYVVSGVVDEIEHDFKFIAKLEKYRNKGIYKKLVPLVGGLIIASPLPDELGLALIGSKKMSFWKFISISFIFNFIGIFIVASLA